MSELSIESTHITVRVLFFAKSKDIVGAKEHSLNILKRNTYKNIFKEIVSRFRLESIQNSIVLARNGELFNIDEDGLVNFENNDEIAVIPPLSGG
ncbi:molybdenum cofactor synthesis 2A [Arctopsyche grandis]|uniref:molybdenum cofactor synthesis 2A n=1 Tax=Arctopsyche grandis TaxID=121162 RepID=UPI00406DA468